MTFLLAAAAALALSGPAHASLDGGGVTENGPHLGKGKCKGKGKGKGKGRGKCKGHGKPPAGSPVPPAPEGEGYAPGGKAELQPVGFVPLSSEEAATRVFRSEFEPRPENAEENATVATAEDLALFHAQSDMPYQRYVDGQFTGTTDEIIQWAAHKWGLPEDLLRATAVVESWWDMDMVGDNGDSFGIFQMRRPWHCCLPFMRDSTAFNADYYGGIVRSYYDGKQSWLNNSDVVIDNVGKYVAGDLWGSVGAWYSGRWHTPGNEDYVGRIKWRMDEQTWINDPWFASHD